MNGATKIALYTILIVLATVSGFFASKNFKAIMDRSEQRVDLEPEETGAIPGASATLSETPGDTNSSPVNPSETNSASAQATITAGETNDVAEVETNTLPIDTLNSGTKAGAELPTAMGSVVKKDTPKKTKGGMGLWTGLFLLSIVSLGIMLALDISHMFGNRALKTLYNDDLEGIGDPAYELAEKEWSNGNHLEAVRMMREYLNNHPREQHVAIRIAEIYEKDLNNPLAAALEYEEIITKKLAPDRWGWAAIHLCNLYFKLGQEQKAFALLRRIVAEHPDVPAAEKARKRLEQIDGGMPAAAPAETPAAKPAVRVVSAPQDPPSNLPPGFRPKK
ncbi:MAG: tetratricopeptide repeat protein [Verrucomicrobiales bacterium]